MIYELLRRGTNQVRRQTNEEEVLLCLLRAVTGGKRPPENAPDSVLQQWQEKAMTEAMKGLATIKASKGKPMQLTPYTDVRVTG